MAENIKNKRSDLKLEITDGRLILEVRLRGNWKLPIFAIVLLLIFLAILQPEKWLDILKAFLTYVGPVFVVVPDLGHW